MGDAKDYPEASMQSERPRLHGSPLRGTSICIKFPRAKFEVTARLDDKTETPAALLRAQAFSR